MSTEVDFHRLEPPGDPLATAFAMQARACEEMGSPVYATMARTCVSAVTLAGPIAALLEPYAGASQQSVLPLRFFATLHRLALRGEAPELARHFPSCGGDGDAEAAAAAILSVVERCAERIDAWLPLGVQTSEVSRAAALLGGFLEVAATTRLPLRILELGASAGFNLRFDRYAYRCGPWTWGDLASEVVLDDHFVAPPDRFASASVRVVERRGCDLQPLDARDPDDAVRLRSYVWPDQRERLALLGAATIVAARSEATVDRASAADWLEQQLATPRPGVATVVFHSVMMQYLDPAERATVAGTIAAAGALATPAAPLAHLSLEPSRGATVALRLFPGDGTGRPIAHATLHGRNVRAISPGS